MFKKSWFWLIIILLLAASLRLYKISDYLQFLGDQGRDVLIVKQMIVDHHFTLLGPNASVGGFFTGPVYYYMMIPFLWVSNLDPVGPAYLSALFGIGLVALCYFFCKLFWNEKVALMAAFLAAICPKLVEISRYSWNPNPVPFFTLLAVLLTYLAKVRDNKIYSFGVGLSLGILYELHYIDLAFIPIIVLIYLLIFGIKKTFAHGLFAAGGFFIGIFPFFLFEVRHGFPNTRSVIEFVTRGGNTVAPRQANFLWLIFEILRRLFEVMFKFPLYPNIAFLWLSLIGFAIWVLKNLKNKIARPKIIILGLWIVLGAFGVGSYKGQLYDHYFIYLYPLAIILPALFGDFLLSKKILWPVFLLGSVALIYFSTLNLYFWQPPNHMVDQVKQIDQTIINLAEGQPFNFALISSHNSDFSYRYFLEIWNKSPKTIENPDIDPNRTTVTGQLLVVCEEKKCEPLGHPLWEIAGFGRAEIVNTAQGPAGIRIFKLIHYTGK